MVGSQDETDGARGEVIERAPRVWFNEESLPGVIQQEGSVLTPVVEGD